MLNSNAVQFMTLCSEDCSAVLTAIKSKIINELANLYLPNHMLIQGKKDLARLAPSKAKY